MITAVAVMLAILGARARSRKSNDRARVCFAIAGCLVLLEAVMGAVADLLYHAGGQFMVSMLLSAAIFLPILLIVWGTTLLRDNWIFRTALALWIVAVSAAGTVMILGRDGFGEHARTEANLRRCGELLKAGKRAELNDFFRKNYPLDHRGWNDAFEAKFPPEGGRK